MQDLSIIKMKCRACSRSPHAHVALLTCAQGDVLGAVQTAVESITGFRPGVDQPLMEAGLDSLGAVELRNKLASRFAIEMPATVIFDYPTISALVQFLSHQEGTGDVATNEAPSFSKSSLSYMSEVGILQSHRHAPCFSLCVFCHSSCKTNTNNPRLLHLVAALPSNLNSIAWSPILQACE